MDYKKRKKTGLKGKQKVGMLGRKPKSKKDSSVIYGKKRK